MNDIETIAIIDLCQKSFSNDLNLSFMTLSILPEIILELGYLQHLYLSDNHLNNLPESFFPSLTNLVWLDLRNNSLSKLPDNIGDHGNIETLLLQNNELTSLPISLGNVKSLKALSLSENPLNFPPNNIKDSGLVEILSYLKQCGKESSPSNSVVSATESVESSRSTLDQEIVSKKSSSKLSKKKQQNNNNEKQHSSVNVMSFKVDYFPTPPNQDLSEKKMLKEIKLSKRREKNTTIDNMLQKVRDDEQLGQWREEAKQLQNAKLQERYSKGYIEFTEPIDVTPFAIDSESKQLLNRRLYLENKEKKIVKEKPANISPRSKLISEMQKIEKEKDLESKIHDHLKLIEERRKHKSSNPQEELAAAQGQLKIAQELQKEIEARRKQMELGISKKVHRF